MDKDYVSLYHALEESHWWFVGRRDMVWRLLKDLDRNLSILEVGCSGGPLIRLLQREGFAKVAGIDINECSVQLCRSLGDAAVKVADGCSTGFSDEQFDVVVASDVLEHIEDPVQGLREWSRILRPKGIVLVFVPAFQFLWSRHDEVNRHYRRYTKQEIVTLLEQADFYIERAAYWNFCFFFPALLVRTMRRIFSRQQGEKEGSDLTASGSIVNRIFEAVLKAENSLLAAGLNFPFGLSLFAIARKP
ncbi:MAG: class I SAM-dependent methyltransferase [Nitrospirae bacterium]|nr:class I SAM-dependent methyltransferase [Nitrospirota bacterium]